VTRATGDWRASAAYRLGLHWQQVGDYVRAEAAYADLLERNPRNLAALYNRAVTQIRLDWYGAARMTLSTMAAEIGLPPEGQVPRHDRAPEWEHDEAYPVAYSRALALHYDKEAELAEGWSAVLAVGLLGRSQKAADDAIGTMEQPALMLHAGAMVARASEQPSDGRSGEILEQAVEGAAQHTPDPVDRGVLLELLKRDRDPMAPRRIEAYVRREARENPRAHYNLACYAAGLATFAPSRAGVLRERARREAEIAFRDPTLVPWAGRDPSLKPLQADPRWQELLVRYQEPVMPSATAPEADAAPAPLAAEPPADPVTDVPDTPRSPTPEVGDPEVDRDRQVLVEQALVLVEQLSVHAHTPAGAEASERLRALSLRATTLGDERFHAELAAIVAGLGDPCSAYLLPEPYRGRIATLPLRLAAYYDADGRRLYVVADVRPGIEEEALRRGTQILRWDGEPIDEAVDARAVQQAARGVEGRRARALAAMTHRPLGLLGPPPQPEVRVTYRVGHDEHTARLRWTTEPVPVRNGQRAPGELDHALAVDEMVETIRRTQERAFGPRDRVAVVRAELPGAGARLDYLRVPTFHVPDAARFVDDVRRQLESPPQEGLVLDVRGNTGGLITAAEGLLQLLSPRVVEPEPMQFANTPLTRALIARDVPGLDRMEGSSDAEAAHSDAFPVLVGHATATNNIGQVYQGPVLLLVDARSSGATDFLIAGFADHALGPIVSADGDPGTVGHNAWSHEVLRDQLRESQLEPLPRDAAFHISMRRGLRVGRYAGQPLEERPARPDHTHRPTLADLNNSDIDLFAAVRKQLSGRRTGILRIRDEALSPATLALTVTTRGLTRLDAYLDGRPSWSRDLRDGDHPLEIPLIPDTPPSILELQGFADEEPAARRRVRLGRS
jgi:C-terminal processing protease CtpA/Prc